MRTKYKHRFDRIYFRNLWLRSERHNRASVIIIGITRWFSGPSDYCWKFCFFGLEAHLWFIRKPIEPVAYTINTKPQVIE